VALCVGFFNFSFFQTVHLGSYVASREDLKRSLQFFLLKPPYILSNHITKRTFKKVHITKRSLEQNHMETTEIEQVKNTPAVS
jgi:hypothetical protein